MEAYKNSWAQGWTAKASKEPNPPAPAARPAARSVSSPFLQDALPDFCKKSVQGGWCNPGRPRILPDSAAFCPHPARILLHSGALFLESKTVPKNIPKDTPEIPPKVPQKRPKNTPNKFCIVIFLRSLFQILLDLILSSKTTPFDSQKVDSVLVLQ